MYHFEIDIPSIALWGVGGWGKSLGYISSIMFYHLIENRHIAFSHHQWHLWFCEHHFTLLKFSTQLIDEIAAIFFLSFIVSAFYFAPTLLSKAFPLLSRTLWLQTFLNLIWRRFCFSRLWWRWWCYNECQRFQIIICLGNPSDYPLISLWRLFDDGKINKLCTHW